MQQFLKSKGLKEKSINTYISIINKITNKLGKRFTEKQLEDFMATLSLKPSTYNLYRAVMNFYTKKELGYEIKFSKAKQNKFLPTEVTREEFKQFLSTIPNIKHKIGFRLMYESGLRVDEAVNTKKYDLKLDELTLRVRGKGNKDRYTILNKTLAEQLNGFLNESDKNNPYIFQNGGGHITVKTFQERLKKARFDSRMAKEFTCRSLRHSFAINLVNDGIDLDIVRKMMGHSSLRTTQVYLQCRTINLTKIAERVSVL